MQYQSATSLISDGNRMFQTGISPERFAELITVILQVNGGTSGCSVSFTFGDSSGTVQGPLVVTAFTQTAKLVSLVIPCLHINDPLVISTTVSGSTDGSYSFVLKSN